MNKGKRLKKTLAAMDKVVGQAFAEQWNDAERWREVRDTFENEMIAQGYPTVTVLNYCPD